MQNKAKILITGEPGSGKSFYSSLLPGAVELDHYGKADGKGGWILKGYPKDRQIYVGTSTNIFDVAKDLQVDLVLILYVTPEDYRRVMKLKLRDLPQGEKNPMYAGFLSNTKKPNIAINNGHARLVKQWKDKGFNVLVAKNQLPKEVRFGWHRK